MSDETTSNVPETGSLITQVLKELDKGKRDGVKAKLKANLTKIDELERQVRLLKAENEKFISDYNAGLI
jgi:mRNA-degrading endonuclease RelE of RelBE toxin-antitoxin system